MTLMFVSQKIPGILFNIYPSIFTLIIMMAVQMGTRQSSTVGSLCTHHPRRLGQRSATAVRVSVRCNASSSENNSKSFVENMINGLTVAIQSSPLAQGKKQLAILQAGEYDEAAVRGVVDKYIADNKVMMFSFSTCPFCKNAKKLLDDMGVEYTAVELNEMEGGMAIRAELAKKTGRTSMPNIWIGGEGIGGCNDGPGIMTLHKNGELEGMLKQCGAL